MMINSESIQRFPFLGKLSNSAAQLVSESGESLSFHKKNNIIFKGDQVGGVYLVESGCLRVYIIDAKGKESTLYNVFAGESCVLALNSVFSGLRYPAWVDVDSVPTRVTVIPADVFKQLYDHESVVRQFTFDVLSSRIFDLMSNIEELSSYGVEQRIASLLLRRANGDAKVLMSHKEIAAQLGTAREVVTRILKSYEKRGWLKTARGVIEIVAMQELALHLDAPK